MNEHDVDECIRHNGSYATTNVFFRIQSGHSTLPEEQREELGPPYDFRRNTLMHKTTATKTPLLKLYKFTNLEDFYRVYKPRTNCL